MEQETQSTYTLYGSDGSGSTAVEALLAELGLPLHLEIVERDADGAFLPAFKAISPLSQVPVLRLPDGTLMTESGAMMIYLADLVPEAGLAPHTSDLDRAPYLRIILFAAASTYPAYLRFFYPDSYSTDPEGAAGVKAAAERDIWRDLAVLGQVLGHRDWFAGRFTAADIYVAMLAMWCGDLAALEQREPALSAHLHRVKARPKVGAVFRRNGL